MNWEQEGVKLICCNCSFLFVFVRICSFLLLYLYFLVFRRTIAFCGIAVLFETNWKSDLGLDENPNELQLGRIPVLEEKYYLSAWISPDFSRQYGTC